MFDPIFFIFFVVANLPLATPGVAAVYPHFEKKQSSNVIKLHKFPDALLAIVLTMYLVIR